MAKSLETSRLKLHDELVELVGHAYFQPPESVRLTYPAAVYDLTRVYQEFADNLSYQKYPGYIITIIDRDSNVDWITTMLDHFQYCSLERGYIVDNLKHWVFVVYYL